MDFQQGSLLMSTPPWPNLDRAQGFSHVRRSQHQSLMAWLPCECSEHPVGELGSAASKLLSWRMRRRGDDRPRLAGQLLVNHRRRMESLKKVAFEAGFTVGKIESTVTACLNLVRVLWSVSPTAACPGNCALGVEPPSPRHICSRFQGWKWMDTAYLKNSVFCEDKRLMIWECVGQGWRYWTLKHYIPNRPFWYQKYDPHPDV